jgi:septum formation protein
MIILASSSPRRHQLLAMLGIDHIVDPADIDEVFDSGEPAENLAIRLAREKASVVSARHPGRVVLSADTLVVLGSEILGKPSSAKEAASMIGKLAGREHRVVTAITVAKDGDFWDRCDVTTVWFRQLSEEMITAYVSTGESLDKAGSYGVQGYGAVLVDRIEGDYFGVMGLPVRLVVELLEEVGLPYRFTR